MAIVNHAKKEINAKIVYYGPAGSGKNTALTYIYSRIKPSLRGDLKGVPAGADKLLFFDFSPFETPLPNGYRVRLHVYTLTGTVTNPATWKMTLKGADGIVIMVNAAAELAAEARESVSQLRDLLSAYGIDLHETPAVLQLNSFSHETGTDAAPGIAAALDLSQLAVCSSDAARGEGLLEALTTLSRQILDRVKVREETCEADVAPPHPSEIEAAEPPSHDLRADHRETLHTGDPLRVAVLSDEIVSEGGKISIPLQIAEGSALRRVVVTVNIELE